MKTTTNTNALEEARALTQPTREASLKRDLSVSQFWNNNRKLLEEAWAEWEIQNKDNLLIPDETLLDPKLRKAINEAWTNPEKETAVADLWQEIIPGVYSAQFFDVERLAAFRNYLEEVVNAQIPKRAPYGIQLNRYGMMLDPRSEGYFAAPSFQAFYNDIMNRYMRPIARLLLGTYGYDNQTFGFSIQYNPDKDKDLHAHTDASAATLNININLPDEKFTGSEVDFHNRTTGKVVQTIFEPGKAIIHTGNVPHATHPITSGQRNNLVVWLYGDRMQIPRGGASSYGNSSNDTIKDVALKSVTARQRWSLPNGPKDTIAPF
ncbi:2OG-Fe(II) oxygenase [Polaribacter reichenbachii]|uniref:2OG-Fe(II) oxygenase n=1 Tax=Polaribacter reichenbachii TaxID=996801 RepID=A0A1B8U4F2_9FLAO|nr:2OG-Fe(II) oxygenase [Polaribacter reichenbachii]APZ47473.1 2OG-Fe(II) oxygenase [Polaribacter reichenbachii]AUC18112.1 2OG-Fe(II) oxygenase [Polaribacter reichenbachii]OBY66723.1 2OG-Fe(II) oxygenase [Polaribacter reichenbachii]